MATTGIVATAPQASASTLVTNLSVTVTGDMCLRGGTVQRVNVSIPNPGSAGSTSGDTVSGLRAFTGNSEIDGSNFCKTTWYGAGYSWYWTVYRYFSFSGQHTYV